MNILVSALGWVLVFTVLGLNLGWAYFHDGIVAKACMFIAGVLVGIVGSIVIDTGRRDDNAICDAGSKGQS